MNAIIIHGTYGHPGENWFPWLKSGLEKSGFQVFVPKFPTPENQSVDSWMDAFKEYEKYLNENCILIGHSLGCPFILNVLERSENNVKATFLVAGFLGKLGNPELDEINKGFADRQFDWERIKGNCRDFFVFYSNSDPHIPASNAKELASKTGAESIFVEGAGHFNESAGYTKFPLLLEKIVQVAGLQRP